MHPRPATARDDEGTNTMAASAPPPLTEGALGNRRRTRIISVAVGIVVAVVAGTVLALSTNSSTPKAQTAFEPSLARNVPRSIATMALVDQLGRTVSLGQFKGRVVVLADFLTSCQDECPVSTGAFLAFERDLRADHLGSKVSIVEVTVDPARDTPARLVAYERYTGVDWTLLTGTQPQIDTFWRHFGASYDKVADSPDDTAAIDWETGKRYRYDMDHSNNVYLFDASGHERLITEGLPNIHGTLPPRLGSLLSPLGVTHLNHPGFGAWTVGDLASAVGSLLGQRVTGD